MNHISQAAHRNPVRRRPYFPWLEKLEERSQPGSLLQEAAVWSPLADGLVPSRPDDADEKAVVLVTSSEDRAAANPMAEPQPAAVVLPSRVLAAPSAAPAAPSETHDLLIVASAQAVPTDGGGSGTRKYDGTWYDLPNMPSRRQEVATAVLNGEIFVIGGLNQNGQPTNTVEVYNPKTFTWRRAANLPIVNDHGGAAVAAGILYAFGGRSNRTFAYWPDGDVWYEVAPSRYQHNNTAAVGVLYDTYLYVAGGTGGGMVGNELEMYDPGNNVWTTLRPMSVPRNHTAGAIIDGLFYVAAGRGSAQAATAFEAYNVWTDEWYRMPNLPTGRSGVAAAGVYGCLYVLGGEIPGVFHQVEVYDPNQYAWRETTPMPTPRHGIYAAVIDNAVYIPGGGTQQGLAASDAHDVFYVG